MMNALGCRNQNLLCAVAVADRNLLDGSTHVARGLVRFQQQLDLRLWPDRVRRYLDGLRWPRRARELAERKAPAAVPPHLRGQVSRLQQAALGKILRVHVADSPLVDDAKPGPQIGAGADALNFAFFDTDRLVALPLHEELNEIGAGSQCALDYTVYERRLQEGHPTSVATSFTPPRGEDHGGGLRGSRTSP